MIPEESNRLSPGQAENAELRKVMVKDGRQMEMRPSIAGAVRQMNARRPSVKPNGIFKHPETWDQEELDFVADCLKQNIPLYTIANMVHCERHTLSRVVNSRPELKQLLDDKYENLLDEAEYQADRLMKAGNSAIVIHVLSTLGRKRGWVEDAQGGGGGDEGRIVMGLIPDDEVKKANDETAELQKNLGLTKIDPMQMALTEEAVKNEVDRRMNVVEADAVEVSGGKGGGDESGESVVEIAERRDTEEYMTTGGTMQPDVEPDPWASGADSMFFQ